MAGPSVTTTDPICRLFMRKVASVNDASTSQVTGGDDISSCTAVAIGFSSSGRTFRPVSSDRFAPTSVTSVGPCVNIDQVNIDA